MVNVDFPYISHCRISQRKRIGVIVSQHTTLACNTPIVGTDERVEVFLTHNR